MENFSINTLFVQPTPDPAVAFITLLSTVISFTFHTISTPEKKNITLNKEPTAVVELVPQ